MLAEARGKNIYDNLFEAEALHFLQHTKQHYELIVAADVFPYFGQLDDLFKAITHRLTSMGYFIFSAEISTTRSWLLQENARFSHHPDYLQELADKYALTIRYQKQVIARQQEGKEVPVLLIALQQTQYQDF
jgi:predicted TPR repeat methyltransferase